MTEYENNDEYYVDNDKYVENDAYIDNDTYEDNESKTGPAPVTLALVIINVLVFVATIILAPLPTIFGMMDYDLVSQGQVYRMFTAMFLHGGAEHLLSNMVMLYAAGDLLERRIGHVKFALVYLLSGLAGNAVSYLFEMLSGLRYTSVGASGAVYGIMGVIIALALKKAEGFDIPKRRIFLALVFSIYSSFAIPNIDYSAHIGGLLFGLVSGFIIS
ncbi:MAG: rhomboid family intramembrane serine protease [Lachnospiraceae bacterium]|nr:rhomboid family intramembrane serine protease [Lachnospiraceae bacterium]